MNGTINTLNRHAVAYQGNTIYDFDNEIMMSWYAQRIVEKASDAKSILELGLGHGYATDLFSRNFERHLVLEGAPLVISEFRKKTLSCLPEIKQTYFENFSTHERFDVIVMGFVLEHVDDPVSILRKFSEFLSPTGTLFVSVPNAATMNRRLGKTMGVLKEFTELSAYDVLLGHQRYYTIESLHDDLEKAGLRILKIEGIYLKPFTTNQMLSLNLNNDVLRALCALGVDYPELSCGLLAEVTNKE